MGTPLRVLIVEDSPDDAELLVLELRRGGFEPGAERVETEQAMRAALAEQPWDLVLADYALPAFSAPAALTVVRELGLDLPFLVVSGKIGEETAVAMMKAGAHDYIMKGNLARFLPAVRRELRDAEVRRERKRLEREILEISDAERRAIGRDLHDGLGQLLTGVSFLAEALEKGLAAKPLPEAAEAAQISKLVREAIQQARGLARGLFPVALDDGGLPVALRELASGVGSVLDISCSFQWDEAVVVDDGSAATQLYRIAQEAVNNAVRHSRATHITIELAATGERAALTVADDGVGLPENLGGHEGMGLRIMKYRADMIGAALDVGRNPGGGTTVACSFQQAIPGGRQAQLPTGRMPVPPRTPE